MTAHESTAVVNRPEARELEHRMTEARERMLDRVQEVRRRVEHARDRFDLAAMIRGRPLTALGVAAGAGAVAGLVAASGSRGGRTAALAGVLIDRVGGMLATMAIAAARERFGAWLEGVSDGAPLHEAT